MFQSFGKEGWICDCAYSCGQIISRPFQFAYLKSQQPALNIRFNWCEKMCKKIFAGTGLGSCVRWILSLVLMKPLTTCSNKPKHFQWVKRESCEVKEEDQASILPPKLYVWIPISPVLLGTPVVGFCIKCLPDCCALTLPVTELHTPTWTLVAGLNPSTSLQNLKRQQQQARGVARLKSEPCRGSHVLDNYIPQLKKVLRLLQQESL